MPSYNLAIVGMGNVGRALLRLLISKETDLRRRYDIRWRLTGVATRRTGWCADPDGLNPLAALHGHSLIQHGFKEDIGAGFFEPLACPARKHLAAA